MIGCIVAILAYVKSSAMEKATHSVQFVPMKDKWSQSDEEIDDLNKEYDPDGDVII
jgi:hypothetical protein